MERGIRQFAAGQYDQAIACFNEVIRYDPKHVNHTKTPRWHTLKKATSIRRLADYNEAIRFDPKDIGAYESRSTVLAEKGDYARSIDDLSKLLELQPGNVIEWYTLRAETRWAAGRHDEYVKDCEIILQRFGNTEDPESACIVAWTCASSGCGRRLVEGSRLGRGPLTAIHVERVCRHTGNAPLSCRIVRPGDQAINDSRSDGP